ncbi:MAG: tetratricopeptide repeat protein [Brevinematia bacterium]
MKRTFIIFLLITYLTLNCLSNEVIEKGKKYYFSGNFELAKLSFERAIKTTTNDELLLMLGNTYLATGDYKKAIETFKSGMILSSKEWVFEFNLAYSHYVMRDFTNSLNYFLSVIDKSPKFSKSYWFGGMASLRMINIPTTITLWEKYLEISPNGEESENIRKALALLKEYGTNAIPEIIADTKKEILDIESLIEPIGNGLEIKSEQKTLEDTSLEDIEK